MRYSIRLLWKSPGFTVCAVVMLAMGIGANALVFAVLNSLILQPLNVPHVDNFYEIERLSDYSAKQSYPDYVDLRDRTRSFDGLAAFTFAQAGLDTGSNLSRSWLEEVSGNYFDVVGISPYLGRFFTSSDEHGPNSAPYIVLTYNYWQTRFESDRAVIGRVVLVNKHPFTVIGVTPPDFRGTLLFFLPDFFLPMANQEQVDGADVLNQRGIRSIYMTLGHLKPGVSTAQATADVNDVWSYLVKTYPKDHPPTEFALARPGLDGDLFLRPVRAFLAALMLLAGMILLAACANLGSLFALRAADRSREVALRLALGSSRKLILRQIFTEAILISLIGGVFGLLGSLVLLHALRLWRPFPQFPLNLPMNPDTNVYIAALLLALVSGFLFGAVPVQQILRTESYEIIKSGVGGTGGRRFTLRDGLLVVQISICAVLITASLVAVRGLIRSLHGNFGFEPQHALLVDANLSTAGYNGSGVAAVQRRLLDAMESIPGVTSVGLTNWPPLTGDTKSTMIFHDQTADRRVANAAAAALAYTVSPNYFQAAQTRLLGGRPLSWHDDNNSIPVAVVNREFAQRVFGSADDAIGRYFRLLDGTRIQVVAIAQNGKYFSLTEDQRPVMFLPISQQPPLKEVWLVVRSNGDQQQLTTAIRSRMRDLDPGLPFFIETWTQGLDLILFPARVAAVSLGVLGLMGAMLSITGIFGVAAYSVSKRKRELGIRIALGAQRGQVSLAALARPFRLLALGALAGLVVGVLASRVLAAVVYQASARDPLVLAGVLIAMLLLGLLGTWIPAQRAMAINASMLLREE